jgi:site-specific DNA-methyltransferase (adenine-specific)
VFWEKGKIKISGSWEEMKTVVEYPINLKDKELYIHPTIKPYEEVKKRILNSTKEGDIVLDCFMGSGTTAVACKELGRNYIGFELNPKYWQIAVDRVNGITQKDKKLKEMGITDIFDFMEE